MARKVTRSSIQRGKLTLTIAEKRKPLILRAARLAKEQGIPISSLMLDALEQYLQQIPQSNIVRALAAELDIRLKDKAKTTDLIKEVRRRIARSGRLSKAISEERDER
jgi:hypothetical protein